ncbi:DUF465 domain-containing protein [Flavobacterium sp. SUN046]|uniref:YdcH family protein n=1 Tax=Flavobacterium sp. SUN046 TaxID=3002440 RepID=UPI002DBB7652|nr:DUF465 domain-containing protein [Flavobacterium sp. SUN046]MEC4050861.1 DUF465 domain-containing protein [Flavobacterium sp. SUN046]
MERHDLLHEFPEFQEKLDALKASNHHFKALFDKYHEVEKEIHQINTGEKVAIDEYAHELKAKLLHLKDEIFTHLRS